MPEFAVGEQLHKQKLVTHKTKNNFIRIPPKEPFQSNKK